MALSSSSSRNWEYDVFLSFRGEDVRGSFRSHLLKELDRKLITAFKDDEATRSNSLWPELEKAIRNSRIAVVIFSENYASSSWCLNELLEIVNCEDKKVIPVFYGVDPSDVRLQKNDFGKIFETTCERESEEKISQWKKALTDVANKLGYHSKTWGDEAKMIEDIANDLLSKLLLTPSKDFEGFVGLEEHIAKISELLQLESKEVKMVGIWGSSGIGKTTIARTLFNQRSRNFQVKKFIDKAFVYKSKEIYCGANPDDHNMKLHLLRNFLSEILRKEDIEIDHLGAVEERLKSQKVLLVIDDLDDLMVLDTLVGQLDWFGSGSRIIVVTKDRHLLRSHKIDLIHEVSLPTEDRAIEMLCQSAFRKKSPLDGFEKLVVEVVRYVDRLPIALTVLGTDLRERKKEYWMGILPRIQYGLHSKIEEVLRLSYDGLKSEEDKAIFRYIACYFNHVGVEDIKLFLADSNLCVNIGLEHLQDKSLIHIREGHVVMHHLLQEMGKKLAAPIINLGEREFLVDSKDIMEVLTKGIGTQNVLGILWHIGKGDQLNFHEISFKGMSKLRYLKVDLKELGRLILPESLDYLPPTLKLLCWRNYPLRYIASGFSPENLVELEMIDSKLEELWEGVVPLSCLRSMNLGGSSYLKKIPDLSKATNLEKLKFSGCLSLVELPSSIRNLSNLLELDMACCYELKILPTGFNPKSLNHLTFLGCSKLMTFPEFSTDISYLNLGLTAIKEIPSELYLENLVYFSMGDCPRREGSDEEIREESDEEIREESDEEIQEGSDEEMEVQQLKPFKPMLSPTLTKISLREIPNLVELPDSFKNIHQLKDLFIGDCSNLKTLPTRINLQSLDRLDFSGCSRLKSFPNISTNIEKLNLDGTGIEEVPCWIENFYRLKSLSMEDCRNLRRVTFNITKLKDIVELHFRDCRALTIVDLFGASFSPPKNYVPTADLDFTNCFKLDPESLLQHQLFRFKSMILPGEEVSSYFTHKTIGTSSRLAIPLLNVPHSQPFLRVKICVVVSEYAAISAKFQFKGKFGKFNHYANFSPDICNFYDFLEGSHLFIYDYCLPRYKDNAPRDQRNYDHVNMKIRVYSYFEKESYNSVDNYDNKIYNQVLLKFGIQLSDYGEDNYDRYTGFMSENGEEYGESDDSDTDIETENSKMYEDSDNNDDSDTVGETENGEETRDNNIDRENQEANAATQLPISKKRDSTFVDAAEENMLIMNESVEECEERSKKTRKVSKD